MSRIVFLIPRQHILIRELMRQGIKREEAEQAIKKWHLNFEAKTDIDKTCFKLFEQVQEKIKGK